MKHEPDYVKRILRDTVVHLTRPERVPGKPSPLPSPAQPAPRHPPSIPSHPPIGGKVRLGGVTSRGDRTTMAK